MLGDLKKGLTSQFYAGNSRPSSLFTFLIQTCIDDDEIDYRSCPIRRPWRIARLIGKFRRPEARPAT